MVRQHVTRRRAIIVDMHGQHDHVAAILDAWRAEDPGLDVSPVAIFGRVTRIDRYLAAALRGVYRRHQLDGGEYDVLAALRRSGPGYRLTPTELYRSMLVTSATMTERLDGLSPADRSALAGLLGKLAALLAQAHGTTASSVKGEEERNGLG